MATGAGRQAKVQRQYYTDTALRHEQVHAHEGSGDPFSMKFFYPILRRVDAQFVLDVGTAAGRNLCELKKALSNLSVCGVEPVAALVDQARRKGDVAGSSILQGRGEKLPFPHASFDLVCEFSVLHHVSNPNAVVKEMLRVPKTAVCIAGSNRFGQGSRATRPMKLLLSKTRLGSTYNYLKTSGEGYQLTAEGGLAYS